MTDEERQELCRNLRALSPGYSKMDGSYIEIGLEAADEIERLAEDKKQALDVCERLLAEKAALAQSDAEPRGSESSAWAAFWISEAARGHKYEDLQVGFHAGWLAALAQSNAEPQGIWRHSAKSAASDNASLRKAGIALAEAALRVIREYDGTHRLALAVADWSKVVANEGGRALAQSDAEPVSAREDYEASCGLGFKMPPPRSDVSAELIEIAEIAEQQAAQTESAAQFALQNIATAIRIRATALPRPDASAGLIEAAVRAAFEEAAQIADSFGDRHEEYEPGDAIRARAADRSRK